MTATTVEPKEIAGPPQSQALIQPTSTTGAYMAEAMRIKEMVTAVHWLAKNVMVAGVHYGVIPGTEKTDPRTGDDISKPVLYQPGMHMLCMTFSLRAEYENVSIVELPDFIAVTVRCRIFNNKTGGLVAEGIGTSNSRESKYTAQTNIKKCPSCDKPSIFKSRDGGWFCWKKKGGCGATFKDGDPSIENQEAAADTNAVWNQHNTIVKIGNKRALASAITAATAAGSVFDIDLDDDAPSADQAMTAVQWNMIQNQQKRLGMSGNDFHQRFIVNLCGKTKVSELTFHDAVAILGEMEKVPAPTAKPANLEEAAAKSKEKREAKSKPAADANPDAAKAAEAKAFGDKGAATTVPHNEVTGEVTPPAQAKPPAKSTDAQRKDIAYMATEKGVQISEVAEKYGAPSTTALTFEQATEALEWLRGLPEIGEPGSNG